MKWTNAADQLISQRHLTAKELADRLGITPHAVYQRRSKLGIKFWPNAKQTTYPKSRWPRSYKMTRRWVLERDRWSCVYCGEAANQVDHVIPKNNGGSDLPSNLVAACARCNNLKGTSCGDCPKWRINANL
jgi:5-methylcytosine-specific restriction endonuclease McrA